MDICARLKKAPNAKCKRQQYRNCMTEREDFCDYQKPRYGFGGAPLIMHHVDGCARSKAWPCDRSITLGTALVARDKCVRSSAEAWGNMSPKDRKCRRFRSGRFGWDYLLGEYDYGNCDHYNDLQWWGQCDKGVKLCPVYETEASMVA